MRRILFVVLVALILVTSLGCDGGGHCGDSSVSFSVSKMGDARYYRHRIWVENVRCSLQTINFDVSGYTAHNPNKFLDEDHLKGEIFARRDNRGNISISVMTDERHQYALYVYDIYWHEPWSFSIDVSKISDRGYTIPFSSRR